MTDSKVNFQDEAAEEVANDTLMVVWRAARRRLREMLSVEEITSLQEAVA